MNGQYHLGGPISVAATDEQAHVAWSDSRAGSPEAPAEDAYTTAAIHGPAQAGTWFAPLPFVLGAGVALVVAGLAAVGAVLALRRRSG